MDSKRRSMYGCHTTWRKKTCAKEACESLLNRNKIDPFLKWMVTGDEKWVTYDNVKRKRSWSKSGEAAQTVAKPGLTARKVLLCVWWDWRGIIHYELLPYGQTLKSNLFFSLYIGQKLYPEWIIALQFAVNNCIWSWVNKKWFLLKNQASSWVDNCVLSGQKVFFKYNQQIPEWIVASWVDKSGFIK